MDFNKSPFFFIFLRIAALVFLLAPANIQAADPENCMECHKGYADAELKKTFIHKPFLQKKCLFCHSPDWVDNAAESDGKAQFPRETKKLGSGDNQTQVHLFSIPEELAPKILFIEAKYGTNKIFRTKLRIPPFNTLKKNLSSDTIPPKIFDIQVVEVQRSNLVTAKIKWQTDKLASATLYYGTGNPDKYSTKPVGYKSEHSIELYTLVPDKTYNFLVRVEDIYGNARESTVYSFSTDKSFTIDEVERKADSQAPMHLNSDIYRSDDNYLVRLKATKPVSIEIATYDMPSFSLLKKRSNETPVNHIPLKNIYETNLLMCETCHRASNDNFSHQVHSRAKLGSNIPAEYSRLPNGQISCLTCHLQHASKNQFHLRESSGRKLCIGCHKRLFKNR